MDRIFGLSAFGRSISTCVALFLLSIFAIVLWREVVNNAQSATITATVSFGTTAVPIIMVILVLLFTEKKENTKLIQRNIDRLVERQIPRAIRGRIFGEPFDYLQYPNNASAVNAFFRKVGNVLLCKQDSWERDLIKCEVFHRRHDTHVGYRVSCQDVSFEFTMVFTLCRATLFLWLDQDIRAADKAMAMGMPKFIDEKTLKNPAEECCENLTKLGFDLYYSVYSESIERNIIYLRKDLSDKFAEIAFSAREQYMFSKEIAEWCRTILRMLKFNPNNFAVTRAPRLQEQILTSDDP